MVTTATTAQQSPLKRGFICILIEVNKASPQIQKGKGLKDRLGWVSMTRTFLAPGHHLFPRHESQLLAPHHCQLEPVSPKKARLFRKGGHGLPWVASLWQIMSLINNQAISLLSAYCVLYESLVPAPKELPTLWRGYSQKLSFTVRKGECRRALRVQNSRPLAWCLMEMWSEHVSSYCTSPFQ